MTTKKTQECLCVSEQVSWNVLLEWLLYLIRFQSKLKHSLFTLVRTVYVMLHENTKNDAGVVQKLKAQYCVECEHEGISNKWFEWPLILNAARQASLLHFRNLWMLDIVTSNNHASYWIKLCLRKNHQIVFFSTYSCINKWDMCLHRPYLQWIKSISGVEITNGPGACHKRIYN